MPSSLGPRRTEAPFVSAADRCSSSNSNRTLRPDTSGNSKTRQSDAERANESQIETQYIRFVAQEAGETELELNYVIPAAGPGPDTRRYTLELVIE